MKRQMDDLRTELIALEACLDESERAGSCGVSLQALDEWVLSKLSQLSLEKPEFPSDKSLLLYTYQQIIKLGNLAENDYFNTDKGISFHAAIRKELIRLEDTPFSDDAQEKQATETDIRMLKRSLDILKEFDRFIERIGGYE